MHRAGAGDPEAARSACFNENCPEVAGGEDFAPRFAALGIEDVAVREGATGVGRDAPLHGFLGSSSPIQIHVRHPAQYFERIVVRLAVGPLKTATPRCTHSFAFAASPRSKGQRGLAEVVGGRVIHEGEVVRDDLLRGGAVRSFSSHRARL